MNTIPSIELTKEILNLNVTNILNIKNSYMTYETKFQVDGFKKYDQHKINIYEFAHMCKKWANNLDEYIISSSTCESGTGSAELFGRYSCSDSEPDMIFGHNNDTEIDSIIQACEWILKKHNKGN